MLHMNKIRTIRKLVDASVLLGLLNTKDRFREASKKFFTGVHNGDEVQLIIPPHTFIEVNTKMRKIKKKNKWTGLSPFQAGGPEFFETTVSFVKQIEQENLYDWLGMLGSQDAIYAAVAYLEGIPLVTADQGFLKVSDKIQVELLNPTIITMDVV